MKMRLRKGVSLFFCGFLEFGGLCCRVEVVSFGVSASHQNLEPNEISNATLKPLKPKPLNP